MRARGVSRFLFTLFVASFISAFGTARAAAQSSETDSFADARAIITSAAEVKTGEFAKVTVLDDERSITIDDQHRLKLLLHRVYRIEEKEALEDWSHVTSYWAPWHQKRPVIRARVIHPDGSVYLLDPKDLTEAPAHDERPEVFDDERVLSAPLPAVSVGAIVELEVVNEDTSAQLAGSALRRIYFGKNVPVRRTVLTIDAPESLSLRYVAHLLPKLTTTKETSGGHVRIRLEQGPMDAWEDVESALPSEVISFPAVVFSTGESWNAVAAQYHRSIESAIRPGAVSALLTETKGLGGIELVRRIVNNLHHKVRYTGVEFGQSNLIPHAADKTLARGYGDCKDKAVLLASAFQAAGMHADVALLTTRSEDDTTPELPAVDGFNHAIVYMPDLKIWIDATAEFLQPGELPFQDQARYALIINPATRDLVRTPVSKPEETLLVERREFYLPEFGPARIVETSEPSGETAANYRSTYGQAESKETRTALQDYVKETYLAEKLDKWEHTDGADLMKPFQLRLEVMKGKRGTSALEEAVVAIRPSAILTGFPSFFLENPVQDDGKDSKTQRKNDAEFRAFATEWRYKIVPPAQGFDSPILPQDRDLTFGPASLTQRYRAEKDGTVSVVWHLDSGKGRYSLSEMKAFREAAIPFRNADPTIIQFRQTGAALIAAGKSREGVACYRALLKLHPTEALHHIQLAYALLGAGFGEQARAEANKAVELEPKSAMSLGTLGFVLQHNALGKRYGKGFDIDGAIASYKKAIELDAKSAEYRSNLAILYEYDSSGERYSQRARLNEAIDAYRELKKANESESGKWDDNVLYALFYAKRYKELIDTVSQLNSSSTRQNLELAATAASESPSAAIQKASRMAAVGQARSNILTGAANILLAARQYPAATQLLEDAIQNDSTSSALRGRIQLMASLKPKELVLAPEGDPRRIIQQLFIAMFDSNGGPERFGAYIENDPGNLKLERQSAEQGGYQLRNMFAKINMNPTVATDLMLSMIQMNVDGNATLGYRVRVATFGKNQTALIAPRPQGLRILAFGSDFGTAGTEVLRRVTANDLTGAAQWLNWIREEQKLDGGDDPFAGSVFPRFWKEGDAPEAERMKIAGYALVSGHSSISGHIAEVLKLRDAASESNKPMFDMLLAKAATTTKDWNLLRDSAIRMLAVEPRSDTALSLLSTASMHLKEWSAWEKVLEARLARRPDDLVALRSTATLASAKNDIVMARTTLRGLIDNGRAEMQDFNLYAWDALFTATLSNEDVDKLQKMVSAKQDAKFPELHTLACLYAEQGKTKEARELLLRAMEVAGLEEPNEEIFYVIGRIAEQYGLDDAALSYYGRVEKSDEPKFDLPTSTSQLAKRRMQVVQSLQRGDRERQPLRGN